MKINELEGRNVYYMRIQRIEGKDRIFQGALGECIKEVVAFCLNYPKEYRGHFILKVKG